VTDAELEKQNRTLERRLRRMQENVRQLEALQDQNSRLLSHLVLDLEQERARSRELLLNTLPERIVQRLEAGEGRIADRHGLVAVLFGDLVDFTRIASTLEPDVLLEELNELFSGFDAVCERNGVEKIKTIGDAYLAVGGLAEGSDPIRAVAQAALDMLAFVESREGRRAEWRLRIGVHAGPIFAGIVGRTRFAYDVWGDTVNVASRLETTSEPGRIHVSDVVAGHLAGTYLLEPRGTVELKGKGPTPTSWLVGPASGQARLSSGSAPDETSRRAAAPR
jgi:class 3 adenylate cyclase